MNAANNKIVILDPRIGSFKLAVNALTFTADGLPVLETNDVAISEVDFKTDKEDAILFSVFNIAGKGVFTAADTSELLMSGVGADVGY